jgi:hypothetical protein
MEKKALISHSPHDQPHSNSQAKQSTMSSMSQRHPRILKYTLSSQDRKIRRRQEKSKIFAEKKKDDHDTRTNHK